MVASKLAPLKDLSSGSDISSSLFGLKDRQLWPWMSLLWWSMKFLSLGSISGRTNRERAWIGPGIPLHGFSDQPYITFFPTETDDMAICAIHFVLENSNGTVTVIVINCLCKGLKKPPRCGKCRASSVVVTIPVPCLPQKKGQIS